MLVREARSALVLVLARAAIVDAHAGKLRRAILKYKKNHSHHHLAMAALPAGWALWDLFLITEHSPSTESKVHLDYLFASYVRSSPSTWPATSSEHQHTATHHDNQEISESGLPKLCREEGKGKLTALSRRSDDTR